MTRKDPKAVLEKVAALERLIDAVQRGEERRCDVCGGVLKYYEVGSGRHPGVYCDTGCTVIHVEIRKRE